MPCDFRIGGFDQVILIGGVGAVAVAQAEVGGGKAERVAGEDVAGPGAGEARQHDGIDAVFAVGRFGDSNDRGIGRRAWSDRSRRSC